MIAPKELKDFREKHRLSDMESALIFYKINKEFEELLEKHKLENGKEATQISIKSFKSTLLNESNVSVKLTVSKLEIENFIKPRINDVKSNNSFKTFLFNTLSSVLGSVIFTLTIIIFYSIGQNQVKSWLRDLIQVDNEIRSEMKKSTSTN